MDFAITVDKQGNAKMTWDKETTITGNVYFSLNIVPGTLFNNPTFGLDLSDIKKITASNINLIRQRIKNALQWLLDTGKAQSIDIIVERDLINISRMNIRVEVKQSDGIDFTYEQFKTVG